MHRLFSAFALVLVSLALLASPLALAQGAYVVKPLVEKKLAKLPQGPLYWRVETLASAEAARAAAGGGKWNPDTVSYDGATSLFAEVAGKAWLFTLGPKGASTPGAKKVAEVGPVPQVEAPEYLLRVNHGYGPPGSRTPTHTHPGSEAFYVVAGRLGQKTAHGEAFVDAGQTMNGHPPGMPMEVFNAGTSELTALIMFVVDATKPFSSPAKFD